MGTDLGKTGEKSRLGLELDFKRRFRARRLRENRANSERLNQPLGKTMTPPPEFIFYLRSAAPKFGDLPSFPVYFQLWEESELEQFNSEYEVSRYAPGFFGFGSDGGGEMFAFDSKGRIFALPFVGMNPKEATLVCDSWTEFASRIAAT